MATIAEEVMVQMNDSATVSPAKRRGELSEPRQMGDLYYIVAFISFYMSMILLLVIKHIRSRKDEERGENSYVYQPLLKSDDSPDKTDDQIQSAGATWKRADDVGFTKQKWIPCFRRESRETRL